MIELLDIRDIIAIFGLFTGFGYYVLNVRGTRKNQQLLLQTRQAQLFMNIYNTYSSKQYQKDRERMLNIWEYNDFDDFFNKYGVDVNPEEHAIWDMFTSHFEGIGVLIKRGLIDSKLVYDLMYNSIILFWDKFELILLGNINPWGTKSYEDIEFLKDEMYRLKEQENRE
jgi:hypothetical protein